MLGLGLSLTTGGVATPAYVALAKAFVTRVEADGGTVESFACLKTDMAYLTSNPAAPAGYTAEWSAATVGSSAEFRINLVGGAGYTYTYAVTDSQATEVTGTGVMGGNIQAVTADLSTLVDGTVTLAVYLTGAGGDGLVVTDTATLVGYTGLLDTYSGAAAAYSLRLLNTSYTGDAIVVRRASDNTTQSIGFVNNELDTASLESFCSGTDGFVTTWYDQSGNANNATQATASSQPKIVSAGSTILSNGKASVDFNGTSDYLAMTNYIWTGTIAKSAFVVGNADSTAVDQSMIAVGYNSITGGSVNFTSEIAVRVGGNAVFSDDFVDANLLLGSMLIPANATTADIDVYLNNTLLTKTHTSSPLNTSATFNKSIGKGTASAYFNGKISEVIAYELYQNTNRTGIETNINTHYSIY